MVLIFGVVNAGCAFPAVVGKVSALGRKRGKIVASVLTMLAVLVGCADPLLSPLGANGVILAFGDSLTVGVGANPENSYPVVLSELTGLKVVGAGVSGETTEEGLNRLPAVLKATRPDLLILIEGGNDILRNYPFEQIQANLAGMIELSQAQGVPVVLLGVPQKKLFSDAAPFYEALAVQYNLVFDGEIIADLLRSSALKSDPIHLNDKGYRKMAEAIFKLLQDNGAL